MKKLNLFNFTNQYYHKKQITIFLIISCIILSLTIIVTTIININQFLKYKNIQKKNSELGLSIASMQTCKLEYNKLIQNNISNFNTPAKNIRQITNAMPPNINLLEINMNDNVVRLKGSTDKHEQIIEFIKNINKNIFKVNKVDIKNNPDSSLTTFEMSLYE